MTPLRPAVFALASLFVVSQSLAEIPAPKVGEKAPTLKLKNVEGDTIDLAKVFEGGKTALVVLRGDIGKHCPLCTAQAASFLREAKNFENAGVRVLLVYPGPAVELDDHAHDFLAGVLQGESVENLPSGVTLLLDPDLELVSAYNLRWEAPTETAYPATFIVAKGGEIKFAHVSDNHGDRIDAKDALAAATE